MVGSESGFTKLRPHQNLWARVHKQCYIVAFQR